LAEYSSKAAKKQLYSSSPPRLGVNPHEDLISRVAKVVCVCVLGFVAVLSITEGNIRALHVHGNGTYFHLEHADNPHGDVMVWLGALWMAYGRHATSFRPEQIDRIRSVAQLWSVQAGEVLDEPSQADVSSSLRWKAISRLAERLA
jgi:hypothetical protein